MVTPPGGQLLKYYVVLAGDEDEEKFYVSRKKFSTKPFMAACFSDTPEGLELAQTIAKRYNGRIEEQHGYDVSYKNTLADVEERSAKGLLAEALKICKLEGWSWLTTATQAEQLFNSAIVKG